MRHKPASKPLVSVILPVFNASKYLPEAIESLLSQTYKNIEIVAIDDASTDGSYELLRTYSKRDRRVRVYRNRKNRKIALTLNYGISKAKGDLIARMDADDIALPKRLEKQVSYLLRHPKTVIVGTQCRTIDIFGRIIGKKQFPTSNSGIKEALFTGNPIQHPSAMINRTLLPKTFSWYDPQLPPAEDLDLFFRLGSYGRYANLKSFLFKYRLHQGSETFKNPLYTFSQTQVVRQKAVFEYGYIPTPHAKIVNALQVAALAILPESFIYPAYLFARGIRSPFRRVKQPIVRLGKSFINALW